MKYLSLSIFITVIVLVTHQACTPKLTRQYLRTATLLSAEPKTVDVCNDKSNYIPDPEHLDHTPERTIRVNMHFIRDAYGNCNFDEAAGVEYAKTVIYAANQNMRENKQMLLPEGNDTPAIPTRYKYVLAPDPNIPGDDGIYFHNDDDYYFMINKGKHRNNYDRGVFKKYGIQKDTVLNVFVQDNHRDSLLSPNYNKYNMNGIAFDTWVKCSMWYTSMQEVVMKNGKPFYPRKWLAHKQLNHEIGHVLGLRHTWAGNDFCSDTPHHPNCWSRSEKPPCNQYSNNIMDYNPKRNAWTPCQIGITHYSMTQIEKKRKLLVPTWCTLNKKPIVIDEPIEWDSCKDLESDIVIEDGGVLIVRCRVSLPHKAKIQVLPGGKLIVDGGRLHNDCGQLWKGIEVWKEGNQEGKVILQNQARLENMENEVRISSANS